MISLNDLTAQIKVYRALETATLPTKGTDRSAAWDIYAAEEAQIRAGKIVTVSTGLVIQVPKGYHLKIVPRSSVGTKRGVLMPNCTGIIDQDYCGPEDIIKVPLYMLVGSVLAPGAANWLEAAGAKNHWKIEIGDRIAQMLLEVTPNAILEEITSPPEQQNRGGFGSTGMK